MLGAFSVFLCLAALAGVVALPRLAGGRLSRSAAAIAVLLPLAFFGRGLVGPSTYLPADHARQFVPWYTGGFVVPRNPFLQDLTTQYLPWAKLVADSWKAGELPLRNPWNGCGAPLAANGLSGAFSPLAVFLVLLPLPKAFTLLAIVKAALALVGMWLWLTGLGVSNRAAIFGGVVFALSFAMIPWIFYVQSAVVCLWPWCLFAIDRLRDGRARFRRVAFLAGLFVVLLLQGHLESVAIGALFVVVYLAARWAARDLQETPRVARDAAVAGAVALAATAAAWIPQTFAILASNRMAQVVKSYWSPIVSLLPHGPAWKGAFVTPILPRIYGDGIKSPLLLANVSTFPEMALGYFGVVGLAVALLVLRPGSPRRRTAWALVATIVVGVGIASGTWPFAELQVALPLYRWLFPIRFLSWLALGGSALAAFELDRLTADLARSGRAATVAAGIAAAVFLFAAAAYLAFVPRHRPTHGLPSERNGLLLATAGLAAFAALVLLASARPRFRPALPLALALVAGGELAWQGLRQYEYVPIAELFPTTPLIRFLGSQRGAFRVLGEDSELYPATNVFAGLEDVRTHDAVERRDYVAFLHAACGYPPGDYIKFVDEENCPALDFLNVRFLVSRATREPPGPKWRMVYGGADGRVFENRDALPRVFAPADLVVQRDTGGSRRFVRDALERFGLPPERFRAKRDWGREAWILGPRNEWHGNGAAELSDWRERGNRASFHVRAAAPAVLVASVVNDGGWRARDGDGATIETGLANGPFLALKGPAGERVVSLEYAPPGWRTGFWISAATVAALIVLVVVRRGQT